MKRLGLWGTYLFTALLMISLALGFSQGDSIYCGIYGYHYAQLGFDCSNHVNSFLSAFLGNPQTYFFTISILLVILLFFHHIPYLRPEYWVRVADNPARWVVKKILLISLEVTVVFYPLFVVAGMVLGFTFEWEIQLLLYPLYLFVFTALVVTLFHVFYVLTEKYIVALFVFFFTNLIYFNIIDEIAWQTSTGDSLNVDAIDGVMFPTFNNSFIIYASIFYVISMLIASSIALIIALKRKECYK